MWNFGVFVTARAAENELKQTELLITDVEIKRVTVV